MFKKNDPLVESVKAVMEHNQLRRDVEAQLNEEIGIASKRALPHEYHAEYDALLEQRIAEAEGSHPRNEKEARLAALKEPKHKITHADVLKGRGVIDETEAKTKPVRGTSTYGHAVLNTPSDKRIKNPNNQKFDDVINQAMSKAKKKMNEEEGEETREGGAVQYNGKPVVSPTATRAGSSSATRPAPEGASASERAALTNKIKNIMKEEQLEEKAVSKAQQRFFGLVKAIKEKKAHGSGEAEKAAKEMSSKSVKDYASTKHKGLPEKKEG